MQFTTPVQTFFRQGWYASPHFYHTWRMTESPRHPAPLLGPAGILSNTSIKSYQQLATHLFKWHYVQGSMTFSWQVSLPRKHWSLCSLSSLLPCRRKHLPIPSQAHKDPCDCPFPCWGEVGQQSCWGALKSVTVRAWWYNLYQFVSASVPIISELPSQLFTKILQVTKHVQVTAGTVDQIVAIPNSCFYALSCSTWIAGTSSYLPELSPALQHLVTKESINRSSL